jgi:pyruvate-ferredoxin/flavodoxin oxidoreductase
MHDRRGIVDGNEAAASVAYRLSELIAIYPITPSTPMGELADSWAAEGRPNLWQTVPRVVEMQSEGGAAGALHGALQSGALATTFTASQGLLLMLPNMYKIAGELTPAVVHVAARAVATQALSIFGDHSDVMAARATGFALLASNSVQEAQDLAAIAHAATLRARVPFVHFFDGFRTSHELNTIQLLPDSDLRALIDDRLVQAHRQRALSPERPVIRGTAHNPDVAFQARESVNPFYQRCPAIVQETMDRFAALTGRQYRLFDYAGAPDAERVLVLMGSGAETAEQTAAVLAARGEKVGVVKVHLYRPFSVEDFIALLPPTVRAIGVLDRTKEPGSAGEPLYLDVMTALGEARARGLAAAVRPPLVIGGRYGLASKEFTPAMVKAVFDALRAAVDGTAEIPLHVTVGIDDDVSHASLPYDPAFSIEDEETVRCVFWGLGSDGTVGATKNAITIIGEETGNVAQGYFVYDSKKAGSVTVSHLRFGPRPIHAPYLIEQAGLVACHQFSLLERLDVLKPAMPGGIVLLNSPYGPDEVWAHLPVEVRQTILDRWLRLFVIDAHQVARAAGLGGRINTIMQTCFFALSGALSHDRASARIKASIRATYGKRGAAIVAQNCQAVDDALAHLAEAPIPSGIDAAAQAPLPARRPPAPPEAPAFVREVIGPMLAGAGDRLPVSALPVDGTYPVGTARWEKRSLALEIPVWEPDLCIQCGKCAFVCPHAAIRQTVYPPTALAGAPPTFKAVAARFKEFPGWRYTLQVAPEDCTGCGLCIEACPVKDKQQAGRKAINLAPQPPLREPERANWDFLLTLPAVDRTRLSLGTVKNAQLMEPLFEFSGACSGCGETPYLKLLTQLFGDRLLVANATGCSSIYGGNLPTTPWSANRAGRGPAWANSLFEDNAEFGLGMRLALDKHRAHARALLPQVAGVIGPNLVEALLTADQTTEAGIAAQRERIGLLKQRLQAALDRQAVAAPIATALLTLADALARASVWLIGGDGWAYDIGYGGLDHVLASGHNVNVLVLDTEVYSNTGGQASKATPRAAVARFAAQGKAMPKKDLGLLAMAYGHVYVARVAMGAGDTQTLHAFQEADAYDGPSLIIAYSHCIAHGIDMRQGLEQQRLAVQTGSWPLYRYHPARAERGQNPLTLDSKAPSVPLAQYAYNEARFRMLLQRDPTRAETLLQAAQQEARARWALYERLATVSQPAGHDAGIVKEKDHA